jgi:hypothetical protein
MIVLTMFSGYTVFVDITFIYKYWRKQAYIFGSDGGTMVELSS